jgi:hypothetical protein
LRTNRSDPKRFELIDSYPCSINDNHVVEEEVERFMKQCIYESLNKKTIEKIDFKIFE